MEDPLANSPYQVFLVNLNGKGENFKTFSFPLTELKKIDKKGRT
jgi:hypothetical protein